MQTHIIMSISVGVRVIVCVCVCSRILTYIHIYKCIISITYTYDINTYSHMIYIHMCINDMGTYNKSIQMTSHIFSAFAIVARGR